MTGNGPARQAGGARLLIMTVLAMWVRVVLAVVLSVVLVSAAGLADIAGYAVIPGVYLALSPPVGRLRSRLGSVALATGAGGLDERGGSGADPVDCRGCRWAGRRRVRDRTAAARGARAAAMALPLLMGFAYSAAQPLAEASAGSRAAAVLVALPAYLIAAAVVFQTDQRRPIIAGSAAALGGLSSALGLVAAGQPGAAREAEGTILRFRLATARLKDAALPMGRALDSRAGLLLMTSVQQAAAATEFLASDPQQPDGRRRERIAAVSTAAGDLAAALAHRYPAPPTDPLDDIGDGARRDGDRILTFLAEALAGAGRATAVLLGRSHTLPPGLLGEFPGAAARLRASLHVDDPAFRRAVRLGTACGLAGVVAGLLGLGRSYWAVFAAVVVLNAPVAVNRRRALMRIVGTVAGFSPAQSAGGSTSPISTPTKRPRGPVPS